MDIEGIFVVKLAVASVKDDARVSNVVVKVDAVDVIVGADVGVLGKSSSAYPSAPATLLPLSITPTTALVKGHQYRGFKSYPIERGK